MHMIMLVWLRIVQSRLFYPSFLVIAVFWLAAMVYAYEILSGQPVRLADHLITFTKVVHGQLEATTRGVLDW